MSGSGDNGSGFARSAPPTLFLLCAEPRVSDPAWLGSLLAQSGFMGDGDDGSGCVFPIHAQHWQVPITIDAGASAAQQLQAAISSGQGAVEPAALAGLDIVPNPALGHVIALTLERPSPSTRPQMIQRLAFVAATLSRLRGASSLFWPPARLWSNAYDLTDAVLVMEDRGLPPLLHFVAFTAPSAVQEAEHKVMTRGLGWMVGHEMELVAPITMTRPEMLRRIARLAVDAMTHGAYSSPTQVDGLVRGERIDISAVDRSGLIAVVRAKVEVDG